jgi:hypothetical protein
LFGSAFWSFDPRPNHVLYPYQSTRAEALTLGPPNHDHRFLLVRQDLSFALTESHILRSISIFMELCSNVDLLQPLSVVRTVLPVDLPALLDLADFTHLITSNDVPLDSDLSSLHKILSAKYERLAVLNAQITHLRATLT